ncbi:MAG: imelysin family protein [Marinovum sp.]|nr:imelysin family protein [Marinovum sp.]
MIRRITVCLALCLPTLSHAFSSLGDAEAQVLQEGMVATADGFILPAYQAQRDAAEDLRGALQAYCSGAGKIEAAQSSFGKIFLAWQRSSIVQLGPILDSEGPMRVQLWPDPKGFSSRAVRAAIRKQDPSILEPGALVGRSIALTNLTALEGLLFGDLVADTYACDLAISIAAFQADLAEDLVAAWTPGHSYRAAYDTAISGNETYPTVDALLREVLAGSIVHTDRLRKFKLSRGLGSAAGDARVERTEARRSGLGLASIEVGFRALADLYQVPGGLFERAIEIGGTVDGRMLSFTAMSVADELQNITFSLESIAETDGSEAEDLRRFARLVGFHEQFLKVGFPQSLGLVAGFTSADGD